MLTQCIPTSPHPTPHLTNTPQPQWAACMHACLFIHFLFVLCCYTPRSKVSSIDVLVVLTTCKIHPPPLLGKMVSMVGSPVLSDLVPIVGSVLLLVVLKVTICGVLYYWVLHYRRFLYCWVLQIVFWGSVLRRSVLWGPVLLGSTFYIVGFCITPFCIVWSPFPRPD